MANAARVIERDKKTIDAAHFGERTILEYGFSLVGSVRVSAVTTKHSWAIKTAPQLEKPRYVIFALQASRKNVMAEDTSRFDDCNLTNVKLYLNSECYPYDDMNFDYDKNRWSMLYKTYARFCKSYYGVSPSRFLQRSIRNHRLFSTKRIGQERNRGHEIGI
ncbi:hypothetical protein P5V15_001097 [Pogonomyrmex californicus]